MIETCSLKNFVTFIETVLSFVLLRKIKDSIVIETALVLRFRSVFISRNNSIEKWG